MAIGLQHFPRRTTTGEPPLDAENGEEMIHVEPGVSLVLGRQPPQSPGTLYISTKRVVWLSDVEKERGYSVDFLSISLHAISRDPESYPSPCIYAQIEVEDGEDDESEGSDAESNDMLDISKISEMRLIPSNPNQLEALFDIFCECAELNPEPNEDQEEEHNWIFSADQLGQNAISDGDFEWPVIEDHSTPIGYTDDLSTPIGYSNGNHDVAHSMLELQIDDQRFEDAEDIEREAPSGHQ